MTLSTQWLHSTTGFSLATEDLPYSESAESAVLSCVLLGGDDFHVVHDKVETEDFYLARNRVIFSSVLAMHEEGRSIDPVTVVEYMDGDGSLDRAGGVEYVSRLVAAPSNADSMEEYCDIIKNKATQRRVVEAARRILSKSELTPHNKVAELVNMAESSILLATSSMKEEGPVSMKDAIMPTMELIDNRVRNGDKIVGIRTGMGKLDYTLSGLQGGRMYLLAARPGMGKSALRNRFVHTHAVCNGIPAYVFDLEMSKEEDIERMLVMESMVSGLKVRSGDLTPEDMAKLGWAAQKIHSAPIFIDDTPGLSPSKVRSRARRLVRENGPGVVYVDYLQLMSPDDSRATREQVVSEMSRSMKNLARELDCPVVPLAQLSRAPEKRDDHRPRMSDLRDSGGLEQDADVIMFIYREEEYTGEYNEDGQMVKGDAEIIVAKQRNGPTGSIKCRFDHNTMKFYEEERYHG